MPKYGGSLFWCHLCNTKYTYIFKDNHLALREYNNSPT